MERPSASPKSNERFRLMINKHIDTGTAGKQFVLSFNPIWLAPVLNSHGWVHLAPAVKNIEGFSYAVWASTIGSVGISTRVDADGIAIETDRTLCVQHRITLLNALCRMLSTDFDINKFIRLAKTRGARQIAKLASCGWGRMFRSPTAWEDAAKTLLTTNASWEYTKQMTHRLCAILGKPTKSGLKTFPPPFIVASCTEKMLRNIIRVGYRAKALRTLAQRAMALEWMTRPDAVLDHDDLLNEVDSWPGFGPYATKHFMMLMGYHRYLPVDREVARFLGARKPGSCKRIEHLVFYEEWGEFAYTAYKLERVLKKNNWIGE